MISIYLYGTAETTNSISTLHSRKASRNGEMSEKDNSFRSMIHWVEHKNLP
jgi:hypothetical protein